MPKFTSAERSLIKSIAATLTTFTISLFSSAPDNNAQNLCLFNNGQVDIGDGQRHGRFRCDINLNQALVNNSMAAIDTDYCEVSEIGEEIWAVSDCIIRP
jgi:hypothetical protein